MKANLATSTPSAYAYPLLIKQLLVNSLSLYGDQEINYRGETRYTFREFRQRIGQLASALSTLGARHGTTVAVMDWDSHRYLESYFGIPMMGATLFTVNVRLSPQQILYTLNDSDAEIVLVHADFLPVLAQIKDGLSIQRLRRPLRRWPRSWLSATCTTCPSAPPSMRPTPTSRTRTIWTSRWAAPPWSQLSETSRCLARPLAAMTSVSGMPSRSTRE